jgi:hypothetical protein
MTGRPVLRLRGFENLTQGRSIPDETGSTIAKRYLVKLSFAIAHRLRNGGSRFAKSAVCPSSAAAMIRRFAHVLL